MGRKWQSKNTDPQRIRKRSFAAFLFRVYLLLYHLFSFFLLFRLFSSLAFCSLLFSSLFFSSLSVFSFSLLFSSLSFLLFFSFKSLFLCFSLATAQIVQSSTCRVFEKYLCMHLIHKDSLTVAKIEIGLRMLQ